MSDHDSIYPTFAYESYDPARNTVARCARRVPLLWFGLFRPADLVTRTFDTDDGPYKVSAPVTTKPAALAQLSAALPRMNALFPTQGPLDEYVVFLADAVRGGFGKYVTVEWDEIDVITEGDFIGDVTAAMASLDPATPSDPETDRARLVRLSGIGWWDKPFPSVRYFLGQKPEQAQEGVPDERTDDAGRVHQRIIGDRLVRAVPWRE